jgi:hypothetical protein
MGITCVTLSLITANLVIVLDLLITLSHLKLKHLAQLSAHIWVCHFHLRNVVSKGPFATSVGVLDKGGRLLQFYELLLQIFCVFFFFWLVVAF